MQNRELLEDKVYKMSKDILDQKGITLLTPQKLSEDRDPLGQIVLEKGATVAYQEKTYLVSQPVFDLDFNNQNFDILTKLTERPNYPKLTLGWKCWLNNQQYGNWIYVSDFNDLLNSLQLIGQNYIDSMNGLDADINHTECTFYLKPADLNFIKEIYASHLDPLNMLPAYRVTILTDSQIQEIHDQTQCMAYPFRDTVKNLLDTIASLKKELSEITSTHEA